MVEFTTIIWIIIVVLLIYVVLKIVKKIFQVGLIILIILLALGFFFGYGAFSDLRGYEQRHIFLMQDEVTAGLLQKNNTITELSEFPTQGFERSKPGYYVSADIFDIDTEFRGMKIGPDKMLEYISKGRDHYIQDVISLMGLPPEAGDLMGTEMDKQGITEEIFPSHIFGILIKEKEKEDYVLLDKNTTMVPSSIVYSISKRIKKGDSWWVYSKNSD